ncbi:MAG: CoA pyrophosphatase [Bacteroidetes bacterium]|nr:CoA pyrophosphatase [Bacteroidota bacterium]
MTSTRRIREMSAFYLPDKAIKSSVLILLYPGRETFQPNFAVTLRPTYNGVHSGQISLPGGRYETPDETLMQTAIRETYEEIGVDPAQINILGRLTELYIPPSNYLVQPFIGFTSGSPAFVPQVNEVEKIFEIPVSELLDDNNLVTQEISAGGTQFTVPCFLIEGTTIWGATAMILSEFREIVQQIRL